MSECKFCALLAGPGLETSLPNLVLHDANVVAVLNRRPAAPGHVTLILKAHHARTSNFANAQLSGLGDRVGQLAAALEAIHHPDRVVLLGDGKRTAHLHLHLVPEPAGSALDLGAIVTDLNLPTRAPTLTDHDMIAELSELRERLSG